MQLEGKVALVTGGRQGIGAAIVQRFELEGAKVVTCGRGARPSNMAPNIDWVQADVSCTKQMAKLKNHVVTHYSALDVLVNNAGVQIEKTLVDTSDEDWDLLMGANAKGVFNAIRSLLPIMTSGGSIINMSSVVGVFGNAGQANYSASKAGLFGLTKSAAKELASRNVTVNAVAPGPYESMMLGAAVNHDYSLIESRNPRKRIGSPEDMAGLVIFLCSRAGAYTVGAVIPSDGGLVGTAGHDLSQS